MIESISPAAFGYSLFGAVALLLIGVCYVQNKDYFKYSQLIMPILQSLLSVLKAVGGIIPGNDTLTQLSVVLSAAIEAAGYAENLWLQGEIDKTLRPQYAQEYIKIILENAGVEVTPSIETIISGAIALTCYLMPHHEASEEA